jgi:hypothetical protein
MTPLSSDPDFVISVEAVAAAGGSEIIKVA